MHHAAKIAIAVLAACSMSAAHAQQDPKPDRSIKFRQGVLNAMGWNMGNMNAMIKGDKPFNKDEFLLRATYVDQLAHMPWEGFTPGSDQGAPTKAKPEIWKDQAKFRQYQEQLQAQTPKLVAAARSGDMAQVRGPFGDVSKACSNCHDDFRNK